MPLKYVNRKGKTFYLHQGTTKTGKPKYFFSSKAEGQLVDWVPDGFEIYENPHAQVFLRKIQPQLIFEEEIQVVKKGMEKFSSVKCYVIDVKKKVIGIFTSDHDWNVVMERLSGSTSLGIGKVTDKLINEFVNYSEMMRFVLVEAQTRQFQAQRYCFRGAIDDWIEIGEADSLEKLVKKYVKHLNKESYYELM